MDFLSVTYVQAPIQWGPIILGALGVTTGVIIGIFGWTARRIISRLDGVGIRLETLDTRTTTLETNQVWLMDAAQATDRTARKAARKVGVLPRDLEDTMVRPT